METSSILIVGAGRLGSKAGAKLVKLGNSVTAETLTHSSHLNLKTLGMDPRLRSELGSYDSVLFAVPPSASAGSYHTEIKRALSLWNKKGSFIFTSSTSVYSEEEGGIVTENSPLGHSERATVLIEAEKIVLRERGTVLRLAGLYDETSGPHLYYASVKESNLRGDGLINLIHYQDAASLGAQLLTRNHPGAVFLGSDNTPLTRNELVSIWSNYKNLPPCKFLGVEGPLGKRISSSHSQNFLNFNLRYSSFRDFVSQLS